MLTYADAWRAQSALWHPRAHAHRVRNGAVQRRHGAVGHRFTRALLQLYWCFTGALLVLYLCWTGLWAIGCRRSLRRLLRRLLPEEGGGSRSEEGGGGGGEEEGAADAAAVARMGYMCVCTQFTCFTSAKVQILTLLALAEWGI
jgi:hypothetical protein